MIIENNTNTSPTGKNCSIQTNEKFYQKITDELKALQTELFEVKKKVDARDEVIDTLDLNTKTLSVGESTETKNLYVNQDASIQGVLNANEATINTLEVINDFIAKLLHVTDLFANTADIEEADIRSAIIDILKIKQALQRFDTNQDVISFPSEHVTQIGDIANSILIAGLERPTWNGDPIALTSDLSTGLTPNYKGMLETEDELPPTATVGDFYLIKNVIRKTEHGLGSAIYGISEAWEVQLYYELLNYLNKDEINQLFDEELTDDIQRETDIIKGNTPVQVVANGCVMKRDDGTSDRLATAVDAFMLSGPEGMDNIATGSSLDDLVICGQYSADDDLANTITEKPTNEVGAFDIAVGQFSGSKQDIYQLYTGKASQKNYFRIGINKEFNNWLELAYTSSIVEKAKEADIATTHKAILISGKGLNINDLNNSANVYGNIYTGLGTDWVDTDNLPPKAKGSHGFCLEILPNKSNTVQRYTVNSTRKMYIYTRVYDNNTWTEWQEIATLDSNGYVEKAKTADNLNANAKLDGKEIALLKNVSPLRIIRNQIVYLPTDTNLNDFTSEGIYFFNKTTNVTELPSPIQTALQNTTSDFIVEIKKRPGTKQDCVYQMIYSTNQLYSQFYYRMQNPWITGWSSWAEIATTATTMDLTGKLDKMKSDGEDIDKYFTVGLYSFASGTPIHGTPNGEQYFRLKVEFAYGREDRVIRQTIYNCGDGNIHTRIGDKKGGYKKWIRLGNPTATTLSTYNEGITKEI